jgi:drug/metabolite transporter (DMT)-like permease
MSTSVTLLVLAAAVFHALWNAFIKTGRDPLISVTGIALGSGVIALLALPFVGWPDPGILPWLLASVALHVVSMITLSQAYRYGDFSLAYPIARGAAPAMVVVVTLLFLDEQLEPRQLIAVLGVLFGISLFALRRFGAVVADLRSLAYALITAALIAAYTLVDGTGVRIATSSLNYAAWMALLETPLIALYMYSRRGAHGFAVLREHATRLFAGGVMAVAGYAIILWAMTQAPIALVAAFRETSIIIAALIGMFWFKEPAGWRRIAAALIIFASVVYLKMG